MTKAIDTQALEVALRANDWPLVDRLARQWLEQAPKAPGALFAYGLSSQGLGQTREAKAAFTQLLALQPRHRDSRVALARLHLQNGELAEAIKHFTAAVSEPGAQAAVYFDFANALLLTGRAMDAVEHYQQALSLNPGDARVHCNLGMAHMALERFDAAREQFQTAIGFDSSMFEAHNNLGMVLEKQGQPLAAQTAFERALVIKPAYPEALTNLGVTRYQQGDLEGAVEAHRRALTVRTDLPDAHFNLGNALRALGDTRAATHHYQLAIKLRPGYFPAYVELGLALKYSGEISAAEQQLRAALELDPHHAETLRHLAGVNADPKLIPRLLARLDGEEESLDAMHCHYALARILDRTGDYSAAFHHARHANRIRGRGAHHDRERFSRYVDELIEVFEPSQFATLVARSQAPGDRPIFIVGLPRSGTTLVEQILSSHSTVVAGGESMAMPEVERHLMKTLPDGYPAGIRELGVEAQQEAAQRYLTALGSRKDSSLRKTDKLPGNFLAVGLILTLLPGASIVHCRRDTRDSCLSMYLNYFAEGNGQSCDLTSLADYCKDYQRLMDHWESCTEGIVTVEYEHLVADQEAQTRSLLSSLGLPWEAGCLEFTTNPAAVKTVSSVQVRQGIYTSSVGRWQYYQEHLTPLLERLA